MFLTTNMVGSSTHGLLTHGKVKMSIFIGPCTQLNHIHLYSYEKNAITDFCSCLT